MPPALKPAYLIHGDDHGRIAERRANFRALAEKQSGVAGVEVFENETATPEHVAAALNAMTFAIGRRFILVDGAERWKDSELDAIVAALANPDPETTVSFFAREDGRLKAPQRLHDAVKAAGGDIAAEAAVKPWELPQWALAQGKALGLQLSLEAARTLVGHVGERQQRLLRELEKLALQFGASPAQPVTIDVELIDQLTAPSAQRKAWALADALLSGDAGKATATYLQVRAQGERLPGLIYWMGARLRDAHTVAAALDQGRSQSEARKLVRMPPKAADQLIRDATRIGSEQLREAIALIADLELASRGGGSRGASEDTAALLAIRRISA